MRDGWVETTLGEVSALQMGRTPSRRENTYWTDDLTYPFCTIADMDAKYVEPKREGVTKAAIMDGKAKKATKGTLLMSFKLTIGRMGFAARDIFPNEAIVMIEADESKVLNEFLYLRLASMDLTEGSGRAVKGSTLNSASIASIAFLVPPLPEQKRIIDLISSVDSYIDALQQQLESAKRSRNALLHELLTAGGDDWVETTLDRVTECSWGNTETTKSKYVESGFLAYSASGADGFLDWFEHDRTAVVLSAIGAQCGKTWFAEGKWTSIKNTIWLKSDNSNLLDKYLFYLSNTDQFWQIRGQAQPFISLGDVKKTRVLLPPLREQERIVDVISEMDAFIESIQRTSMEAKNLRSGLLSDLLSGSHEIPTTYDKVMGAA